MKVSEILRAGKQALLDHGWCQGDEAAVGGPKCCAATAIIHGTKTDEGRQIDTPTLCSAIRAVTLAAGLPAGSSIGRWNDAPERTLADVLFAYDIAITAAEQQEQGT